MIKSLIIVYSSFNAYYPVHSMFDTAQACTTFQESLERLADAAGRHTPAELFRHGHADTAYFVPCKLVEVDSFGKIHSH